MPNTDTLAANHGQNRSRGRAVRSDSSMISMPVVSTPSRRVCSSPDEGVVVLLMTASSRTRGSGASTTRLVGRCEQPRVEVEAEPVRSAAGQANRA